MTCILRDIEYNKKVKDKEEFKLIFAVNRRYLIESISANEIWFNKCLNTVK